MAWNYQQRQEYISQDFTAMTPLNWGQYYVYKLTFASNITTVTFDFNGQVGSMNFAYPIGFLCESVSDWFNSEETPDRYLGYVSVSTQPLTYDISDFVNCYFVVRPVDSSQSGFARFLLTIGGGAPSTQPIHSATGDNTNSTIYVQISNYSEISYSTFVYYIETESGTPYQSPYQTAARSHTFIGIEDGTYKIRASYVYNGVQYPIPNADRDNISIVTISSTPTPSGDWNYGSPIYLNNLTENYTSSSAYSFKYDNGALFVITFANGGYARFYSSNEYGDMVAFLGDTNSGFNNTNGIPIDYDRSSRLQNGFNIDFYSVTAGTPYYLWVTAGGAEKTNWGTFYLNIVVPTAPIVYPTYTYSVNNNQVTFNVQNRGNYYLSYIARLASDSSDRTYTLYYTTNTQVTTTELLWNTTYSINVGYSEAINGNIEWIGSNQVTIGANPQSGYVYIYDGSNWRKAKPYIYDGDRWRPATAYIYDGNSWKKTTG